jgi:hypothetical protein
LKAFRDIRLVLLPHVDIRKGIAFRKTERNNHFLRGNSDDARIESLGKGCGDMEPVIMFWVQIATDHQSIIGHRRLPLRLAFGMSMIVPVSPALTLIFLKPGRSRQ